MKHWLTRRGAPVVTRWLKRFDPEHWTVDFPRGAMASLVTGGEAHAMTVSLRFLRRGDLAGMIWASEDRVSHPAHARETSRDYRGCVLSFRWQSDGLAALDAVGGPTLTIEGRDAAGEPKSWFVRLWNYASGNGTDARITLNFDAIDGGFLLPPEADPVFAGDIDRMFFSLVPPDFDDGSEDIRLASASVTLSELACDGPGSVLAAGDVVSPDHGLGIASSYDDQYNVAPSRLVEGFLRAGFRGNILHYVGMSHYPTLGSDGLVDAATGVNEPALAWHREFARAAKAAGYGVIWSLSYELLDMFCPESWKQRDLDGHPALTGWAPPSALLSPANADAMGYLQGVAQALVQLSLEEGLAPQFQVGEPWWWTASDGRIFMYDAAANALLGDVEIADVGGTLDAAQRARLDAAGAVLAQSTTDLVEAVREIAPETVSHVLAYLPTVLDPKWPEARRANLPVGWASPAFDRFQIEDYDWLTGGRDALRAAGRAIVETRLGYASDRQHYLAGFVAGPDGTKAWGAIVAGAMDARRRAVGETFLWAWPQVARDGLTLFGEDEDMEAFADVGFPLAIGQDASVSPGFSTNVLTSAGGHEIRNANWQSGRLRFDAGPGVRGEKELETLIAFFRARRGAAVAFRFRDPFDHSSAGMTGTPGAGDQRVGTGDGETTQFALVKNYGGEEQRRITRPEAGSVRVAVGGIERTGGWTLGALGNVQFDEPPATGADITAGYRFDVPVRFAEDQLEISRASFLAGEAPSVQLVEVREA